MLLSLTPSNLRLLQRKEEKREMNDPDFMKQLKEVMNWFRNTFEIVVNKETPSENDEHVNDPLKDYNEEEAKRLEQEVSESIAKGKGGTEFRFSVVPEQLLEVIEKRKGSAKQIAQV